MTLEDTAVAEEVTASPVGAQQEQDVSLAPVSPEIVAVGTEPETESLEAPDSVARQLPDLDGLSDEELDAIPRIRDRLARVGESQRRQALAEAETRRGGGGRGAPP